MPTATDINTTSAPAAGASVDGELLAPAAEFQTVDARLMAINDELMADTTGTLSMDKGEPAAVHDRWWAIVNRVIELPAHTAPGWAAKAAMIPPVIRDVSSTAIGTADINLALSLARDLTGQAGTGLDGDLLTACEAFHMAHSEMKAGRGETPEDEAALGRAMDAWYAAIADVKAIPSRAAAGQQAEARVVYTALHDVLPIEMEDGHREEFAAHAFLAELLGDVVLPAEDREAAVAEADDTQPDRLTEDAELGDYAIFDVESVFFDMRAPTLPSSATSPHLSGRCHRRCGVASRIISTSPVTHWKVCPAHVRTRKSFGLMIRKLSVTRSQ
jgi:hypothetical protein